MTNDHLQYLETLVHQLNYLYGVVAQLLLNLLAELVAFSIAWNSGCLELHMHSVLSTCIYLPIYQYNTTELIYHALTKTSLARERVMLHS